MNYNKYLKYPILNNYKNKYLKYKFKYLNLQKKIENMQNGGMIWKENSRGNSNDGKYPPCYDICGATKAIYDILEKNNLLKKYTLLLDLYSIILCQEVYLKTKDCKNTMLDERLMEINNLFEGKEIQDKHLKIVNDNINNEPKHKQMRELLEKTTVLIEEEMDKLNKETLEKSDLDKLNNMNTVFYQVHYPIVSKNC